MLVSSLRTLVERYGNSKEGFDDHNKLSTNQIIALVVFLVIWLFLCLLVGTWLWNTVACKMLTICKPVKNIWMILGFAILLDLVVPSSQLICAN